MLHHPPCFTLPYPSPFLSFTLPMLHHPHIPHPSSSSILHPPLSFTLPMLHHPPCFTIPHPSPSLSFTLPILHPSYPSPFLSFTLPILHHPPSFTLPILHPSHPSLFPSFTLIAHPSPSLHPSNFCTPHPLPSSMQTRSHPSPCPHTPLISWYTGYSFLTYQK